MIAKLEESIKKEGINNLDLRVGVADRMLENWILADWDKLKSKRKTIKHRLHKWLRET